MGRRKNSGLLEVLVKSAFGFGSTKKTKKNIWGQNQTVVTYHGSNNKKKTYTHGTGLFGDTTKTKTTKGFFNQTVEKGKVRKHWFFGGATETSHRNDGSKITRKFTPSIFGKDKVETTVDGACFKCNGKGQLLVNCRKCDGTGKFKLKGKTCFECGGIGQGNSVGCLKCSGTGLFSPVYDCRGCDAVGKKKVDCRKCGGSGKFKKTY